MFTNQNTLIMIKIFQFLVFAIAFFALFSHSSAQEEGALIADPKSNKFTTLFGISGGMNQSKVDEPEMFNNFIEFESSFQFLASFELRSNNYEYEITSYEGYDDDLLIKHYGDELHYGFRIGLGYIGKGHDLGTYTRTDDEGHVIGEFNSQVMKNYLIMPINVCLYYKILYIKTGFYSGYLLSSSATTNGEEDDQFNVEFDDFDLGIDLGVGVEVMLTNSLKVNIEYAFQKSLNGEYANDNITHMVNLGFRIEDLIRI
jgi:opacity protein-like surface antigen